MSKRKNFFLSFPGKGMLILVLILLSSLLISWRGYRPKTIIGTFGDVPVAGLNYEVIKGKGPRKGITNWKGTFICPAGTQISFSIGDLLLGQTAGAKKITPLALVDGATDASDQTVNNILVLLQTLDQDGDLNNGIKIKRATSKIVSGYADTIDFDKSTTDFSDSLADVMVDLNSARIFSDSYRGDRKVRSSANALAFFNRNTGLRKTARTCNGLLKGFEANDDTWQWIGVPYAKPPVNNLRWCPPKKLKRWRGIRQATEWGDQAAQPLAYTGTGFGGVSENCLTLNIMAPKNAEDLPVMVWFHGGAFGILTSNSSSYNTTNALTTKGVVLVTVNHRLGVFGYMAHPELTAESEYGGSGNYGQMDLVMALKWVKKNIRAFGGNPENVTIFGQSGGGGKCLSLMASPLATDLFHKVISQSGMAIHTDASLNPVSLEEAEGKGSAVSGQLGDLSVDEMRKLNWLELIDAGVAVYGGVYWKTFGPTIDGYYCKDTMENTIKNGLSSDVPLLAGANSLDQVPPVNLALGVPEQMPWRADYNNAPQFVYFWDYVPPGWAAMGVGAYHSIDLIYVFNNPSGFITHALMGLVLRTTDEGEIVPFGIADIPDYGYDPYTNIMISTGYHLDLEASMTFTDNIMNIWTNFAKTGTPNVPGVLDDWPVYTSDGEAFVEFSSDGSMKIDTSTGLDAAFGTP